MCSAFLFLLTCSLLKCYDCELFSRISQKYPLVESFEFLFMFMCIARNPKKNNTNISLLFWSNAGKNVASEKLGPNFLFVDNNS